MSENTIAALETIVAEDVETEAFSLEDFVVDLVGSETDISPYGVWKIMTEGFKALGVEQARPSQMMYNYTRNGMIAKRTKGMSAKGLTYTNQEVQEFLVRFFTKHVSN